MNLPLILTPEAEADIADAKAWYEEKRDGLGEEFVLCVEASLDHIRRAPASASEVLPGVRRVVVRRFPYGIFIASMKLKSRCWLSITVNAIPEAGKNGRNQGRTIRFIRQPTRRMVARHHAPVRVRLLLSSFVRGLRMVMP